MQAVYEPTDLAMLTQDLASCFESAMSKAGLKYTVSAYPVGEPVFVDREMWEKIVLNLLSNAFKFTLHGEVAVSLCRVEDHVELSVQDTGLGMKKNFAEAFATDHFNMDCRIKWRDQSVHWISAQGHVYRNEKGEPIRMMGLVTNIDARKQLEQILAQRVKELASTNAELEQFAFIASHDLQEPLRKVQSLGDLLTAKAGAALGADERDYLTRMQAAAQRMQGLINDLLTYARVTSQARPFVAVDLARVVREVLSDLEARVKTTGGRVEIGTLPQLDSDPLQMRQLLQNLIGNALKFHRPDVPPVIVVAGRVVKNGDSLTLEHSRSDQICEITIQDNGIGFEEKYLDRIFLPFQRLHGRGEYEGTGMGLAICRKIVERHSGPLTARSTTGQGATFVILLPLSQPKGKKRDA
jgi:light-regulated signal transduction histidine kinase (bacteriophytochrome)